MKPKISQTGGKLFKNCATRTQIHQKIEELLQQLPLDSSTSTTASTTMSLVTVTTNKHPHECKDHDIDYSNHSNVYNHKTKSQLRPNIGWKNHSISDFVWRKKVLCFVGRRRLLLLLLRLLSMTNAAKLVSSQTTQLVQNGFSLGENGPSVEFIETV